MLFALVPLNQLSRSFTHIDGQVFDGLPGNFRDFPLEWRVFLQCSVMSSMPLRQTTLLRIVSIRFACCEVFSFTVFLEGPKWNHCTERSISRCVLFCSWTTTTFVAHEVSIFTETQVWHTKSSDSPCVLLTRVYSCLFNNSHVLYI